jgi:hypothetical protein
VLPAPRQVLVRADPERPVLQRRQVPRRLELGPRLRSALFVDPPGLSDEQTPTDQRADVVREVNVGLVGKRVRDGVGGAERRVQVVSVSELGAEVATLIRGHLRVELQIETKSELEPGGEGLPTARRLGARIPARDGRTGYLERIEPLGRRCRCASPRVVPAAAGDHQSARCAQAAVFEPSRKNRASLRDNYHSQRCNKFR